MSNEAQAWAFRQPIPPAPKLVLLALANNANKEGKQCFPSLRLLVENCCPMKERTVQYHLKWLASAKLITITPWFTPSGRQTSNLYELDLTTMYCGEGARSCTPHSAGVSVGEGARSCTGRVQEVAPGRVQELLRGEGARAVAPPDQNLDPLVEPLEGVPVESRGARRAPRGVVETAEVWEAYRLGCVGLYRVEPVRDAMTNAVLKKLVQKFGREEAPRIVRHYFTLDRKVYVDNRHPPTLLLRDCYGIRTDLLAGPRPATPVGPKAYQPAPMLDTSAVVACPGDIHELVAQVRAGTKFSFPTDSQGQA